jgi:hypothetical protein
MLRAFTVIVTFVILALTGHELLFRDDVAGAAGTTTVKLVLGDAVSVQGADLGCRVTRLAGHGKRRYVECRRAGPLAGTYGTYFGRHDVLVVRFVNARTARVVLHAQHDGSAKRCRGTG